MRLEFCHWATPARTYCTTDAHGSLIPAFTPPQTTSIPGSPLLTPTRHCRQLLRKPGWNEEGKVQKQLHGGKSMYSSLQKQYNEQCRSFFYASVPKHYLILLSKASEKYRDDLRNCEDGMGKPWLKYRDLSLIRSVVNFNSCIHPYRSCHNSFIIHGYWESL